MNTLRPIYMLLLLLILGTAVFLRFHDLGYRPMHGDEANQAIKAGKLLEEGTYTYDPFEHHGPTLYYLSLPIFWLNGAATIQEVSEPMLRVVPALFGAGLVLLSWLLVVPLSRTGALWAALLTTVSHGLTYYSRYYVQEISFVFLAAAVLLCAYHYLRTRHLYWALGVGLALGLLHATKETSLLVGIAMVGALTAVLLWEHFVTRRPVALTLSWKHGVAALAVAAGTSVLFFSSFFSHARGPLDSLLTYSTYLNRAEGHGSSGLHEQPWHYYLSLLTWTYRSAGPKWSEGLILGLAVLGGLWTFCCPSGCTRKTEEDHPKADRLRPLFTRFLVVYTLLLTVGFSIIPYKTPWNMMIFLHPICLLAGLGAARLTEAPRWRSLRILLALVIIAGAVQLTQQTWRGIFTYGADVRNPYAYAHTSSAIYRLRDRVADIAAVHPAGNQIHINVFRFDGDYWPLPWYLRDYPNVGYWPNFPDNCDADMLITSPEVAPALQPRLKKEYQIEMNGLRPSVLMPTFIRKELWDEFMKTRGG